MLFGSGLSAGGGVRQVLRLAFGAPRYMQVSFARLGPHASDHEAVQGDFTMANRTAPLDRRAGAFAEGAPVDMHEFFLAQIERHRVDALPLGETAAAERAGDPGTAALSHGRPCGPAGFFKAEKQNRDNEQSYKSEQNIKRVEGVLLCRADGFTASALPAFSPAR
jgi:hypothetical protein